MKSHYFPSIAPNLTEKPIKYAYYNSIRIINRHLDYKNWSKQFHQWAIDEVAKYIRVDTNPNFLGYELIKGCINKKIIKPGYSILQNIISEGLSQERKRIYEILNDILSIELKESLKSLISTQDGISTLAALHKDAKNFGFKMMSQERQKHNILTNFFSAAQDIIRGSEQQVTEWSILVC